jgi:hypothetical protein
MFDVATTESSITEIAFKNGFESREVFTGTFKSIYDAPPSSFRKIHMEPRVFEKINFLSKSREDRVMILKPEIIFINGKLFLSIARKINQSENIKYELLNMVRKEFKEMSKFIENRINPVYLSSSY